ncbi:MAG: hypothetical protein GC137_04800 [Alphaproteobacteria bacterium]|nr:hypothetical protein [Alphaproteobacteria bacterium]
MNNIKKTLMASFLAGIAACAAPVKHGAPSNVESQIAQTLIDLGVGTEGHGIGTASDIVFQLRPNMSRLDKDFNQRYVEYGKVLEAAAKNNPQELKDLVARAREANKNSESVKEIRAELYTLAGMSEANPDVQATQAPQPQ